ncbi:hypothetical protein RF55_12002 [Lasius niger]|uniref:RNA-directed DNA polymerase n=1 Tax=Lasius niger TaxID=67767 RepID=A0A0J7N733_LASNI|nr:hypothetical protein RF55_12002 [Lasius niger]
MSREQYNELSYKDLKDELTRYGLKVCKDREGCINAILAHLEKNGPLNELPTAQFPDASEEVSSPEPAAESITQKASAVPRRTIASSSVRSTSPPEGSVSQLCKLMQQSILMQQSMHQQMNQILTTMSTRNSQPTVNDSQPAAHTRSQPQDATAYDAPQGSRFEATNQLRYAQVPAFSIGNATKFLIGQISSFGGSEEEDVERWIEKIESTALLHRVSSVDMLSAAASKLTKVARKWFDLKAGVVNRDWDCFKQAIISRFRRNVVFTAVMQKVEARKWNISAESFQDYAMDQLALMESLDLTDKNSVQLLISGIGDRAVKAAAAGAYKFKGDKAKNTNFKTDGKKDNGDSMDKADRQPNSKGQKCNYCHGKGHVRAECFKLKKKEQSSQSTRPSNSGPVAQVEKSAEEDNTVATVTNTSDTKFEISDMVLKVVSINSISCNLRALLDTGSPISFIRPSTYNSYFKTSDNLSKVTKQLYKAINNIPIRINGIISTTIELELVPNLLTQIDLHIFQDDSVSTDLIIGRDFITIHKEVLVNVLEVLINTLEKKSHNKMELLSEVASVEIMDTFNKNSKLTDLSLENFTTDFEASTNQQLKAVIKEVNNTSVPPSDEEYLVEVTLKDSSIFAFAPRRFAFEERRQIREITDDLLKREIIQPSNSPYCARVVPVRKKNGSTRLCVDLRPLNERVVKQKYPFLLIEDCLARIGDKSIFTLLDLKDGFHQIKIHPEHTRYFSFATPDELHTDASNLALAGILLQRQSTNHWAPVAYYSQATNKAEMNYYSFELEMLAVVKAIERFHIYLYGIEFTVVTDCHALVFAINKAHLNPRIARWTLRLQNYKFKILHRAGRQMVHVDALSRIVAHIETMPLEKELEYKQLQDQKLKSISEDLEFSDNDKFALINGLVYKKGPDKPRFSVPEAMVNNIVRIYHDNIAHCGVEKTIQGINANYWFPSIRKRVVDHIDNCITCLLNNVSSNTREGELQETDSPSAPLQILHTDHYGPMVTSANGFKHVLVVISSGSSSLGEWPGTAWWKG